MKPRLEAITPGGDRRHELAGCSSSTGPRASRYVRAAPNLPLGLRHGPQRMATATPRSLFDHRGLLRSHHCNS